MFSFVSFPTLSVTNEVTLTVHSSTEPLAGAADSNIEISLSLLSEVTLLLLLLLLFLLFFSGMF